MATAVDRPIKLPGAPKPWMNACVTAGLRTPGLRNLMGRVFALITVTGSTIGTQYTTPIQYFRDGDRLIVLVQRKRLWWRNLAAVPEVELLIRGRTVSATGRIPDDDESRTLLTERLVADPRSARFYGLTLVDGEPDPDGITALSEALLALVFTLAPEDDT